MKKDAESFFMNVKPVRILVGINNEFTDNYASALSSEVDATYSHTVRIIQNLEEMKLVESKKKGRRKIVTLTEEGKEIADLFSQVLDKMKGL